MMMLRLLLLKLKRAVAYGADEVDLVFPYRALIAGNAAGGGRDG